MRGWNPTTRAPLLLAAVTILGLGASAHGADQREMTYVKQNYRTHAKSSVSVNDGAGREIRYEVTVSDIVFSDPRYGKAEEVVYLIADEIAGSGVHRGSFMDTHADGSVCVGDFEGKTVTTTKADGSWESVWEGTYRYTGGSGICKGVGGGGKYTGTASPTQAAKEQGREIRKY